MPKVNLPYTEQGEEMRKEMQEKVDATFGEVPTYEGGGRTQPGNMTDFDNIGAEIPKYKNGGSLFSMPNPFTQNPMQKFGYMGSDEGYEAHEAAKVEKRAQYAPGAEGDKAMLVDDLVAERANLKKGTPQYREVQNKINRLLGVDVKHTSSSDYEKKQRAKGKTYKQSDLDRVKMYKEKNWAMDHTINEAALRAYEEGNV